MLSTRQVIPSGVLDLSVALESVPPQSTHDVLPHPVSAPRYFCTHGCALLFVLFPVSHRFLPAVAPQGQLHGSRGYCRDHQPVQSKNPPQHVCSSRAEQPCTTGQGVTTSRYRYMPEAVR